MRFDSFDAIRSAATNLPGGDAAAAEAAAARQDTLTKPPGSLGRLEALAVWAARWQGRPVPRIERAQILVFAGSHGVARRGVSAFPPDVTAQMVANFAAGGAAINQLARSAGAELVVVPLEVERPTEDFTQAPAMSEAEFAAAVSTGFDALDPRADILCIGEMGIANTTAAAALSAALFGGTGADWVGRGTGVDEAGLARKAAAVDAGLACHADALADPLRAAAALGGRELAAMLGATLAARRGWVPVLVDGFVATAAVAPLARLTEGGLAHAQAGHVSAETAHRTLLAELRLDPILDLGMRLGEGSGAAVALAVVKAALACHGGMASFADAGVATG